MCVAVADDVTYTRAIYRMRVVVAGDVTYTRAIYHARVVAAGDVAFYFCNLPHVRRRF